MLLNKVCDFSDLLAMMMQCAVLNIQSHIQLTACVLVWGNMSDISVVCFSSCIHFL